MAKKEDQKDLIKDLDKYFTANYSTNQLEIGNDEEGELAGKAHLTATTDLEGLLDVIGLKETPLKAIEVHSELYLSKLNQLYVPNALEYLKAPEEMKKALSNYSKNTLDELAEGYVKYQKATKKLKEGTKKEKIEAIDEQEKYKDVAETYNNLLRLNSILVKEKSASKIGDYNRKQVAKFYRNKNQKTQE